MSVSRPSEKATTPPLLKPNSITSTHYISTTLTSTRDGSYPNRHPTSDPTTSPSTSPTTTSEPKASPSTSPTTSDRPCRRRCRRPPRIPPRHRLRPTQPHRRQSLRVAGHLAQSLAHWVSVPVLLQSLYHSSAPVNAVMTVAFSNAVRAEGRRSKVVLMETSCTAHR